MKICKGKYINRFYIIPTIEVEETCSVIYVCFTFLKWYIGFAKDIRE